MVLEDYLVFKILKDNINICSEILIKNGYKKLDTTLFLSKLDALLSYFQIKYFSKEKQEIGFKPPEK